MKKFLALVIALSLVMGLGVTALAAGTSSTDDAGEGKITVVNYDDSATYIAYKIFDVTYADNESTQYSYTIANDSPWFAAVEAYANAADAADEDGLTLTLVPETDPALYVVSVTDDFSAATFAEYLYGFVDGEGTDDITDDSAKPLTDGVASALDLGYWFVTTTTGALCNLTTTNPEVEIYDKNIIEFEKTDDDVDNTVEVGQTLTFTLSGVVPSTTGYSKFVYKVSDEMTAGLTFNEDVKIVFIDKTGARTVIVGTADTTAGETQYEPGEDDPAAPVVDYVGTEANPINNGFVFEFDMTKWQAFVNQDIEVTYTATVNADAVQYDEENNTATLEYSNNPNDDDSTDTITDDEHLYSFNIVIIKTDGATNEPLENATFVLYKEVDDDGDPATPVVKYYYHYVPASTTEPIVPAHVEWVSEAALVDADNNPVTTPDKAANITQVTTTKADADSDAIAEFDGLNAGTYQVLEIKAPDGYNMLSDPIEVVLVATPDADYPDTESPEPYVLSATVDGNAATVAHNADNDVTAATGDTVYDNDVNVNVPNQSGLILPSTGGIGTTIFYVLGGLMAAFAGVMLITKKRMSQEG